MAPIIPRMHLFEIDDQPWFPPFLRRIVQETLCRAWLTPPPITSPACAADIAAGVLIKNIGPSEATLYTFVDFCAGGGGPTPRIERTLNAHAAKSGLPRADFVLTDLYPHVDAWERASRRSEGGCLRYVREPIDASAVDKGVMDMLLSRSATKHEAENGSSSTGIADGTAERRRRRGGGGAGSIRLADQDRGSKGVFRIFNLAFHHMNDQLAKDILKNCVQTDTPFAIFELQDRSWRSVIACLLLGLGMFPGAPYYAWKWRSPATLIFTWLIPILPFVIVFDGLVSSLRTRTPEEVEALLKGCGAEGGTEGWKVRSGRERFLWPVGWMNWVVCMKEENERR
ncbi:hypothetical protein MKZ38_001666 [Zalerion maritima]|uniref:Uncharacterized protein n=1 Tax=Zalerion maritima TaxID=339359 RepID=A0AAD5RRH6_9PEZI|nr:hypothetical protein MKZ38_001666 [Zalerion maritima]